MGRTHNIYKTWKVRTQYTNILAMHNIHVFENKNLNTNNNVNN